MKNKIKRKKRYSGLAAIVFLSAIIFYSASAFDLPDPDIFDGSLNAPSTSQKGAESENKKQPAADAPSSEALKNEDNAKEAQKENRETTASEKSIEKKNADNAATEHYPGETNAAQETEAQLGQSDSDQTVAEKKTPVESSSKQPIPVTIGDDTQTIKVDMPEDMLPETQAENPIYSGDVKVIEKQNRRKIDGPPSTNRTRSVGVDSGETLPTEL